MGTILKDRDLSKKFGAFEALKKVDLQVEAGEVMGFIGPNGAGKSTTIRILLGMLRATSGRAQIFGLDVWSDAVEIHKRLAYVPGDVNLWPNLTDGEVIDLFLSLQGSADRLGSAIGYLSSLDILKLESTPPTLEDLFMRRYEQSETKRGDRHA
ncbi:hypothetical protein CDO73_12280 [Saccharibacillus sp. O23]|nr:hypothetical protein CDO73_12280 [Saccharibacillus sp. O23]